MLKSLLIASALVGAGAPILATTTDAAADIGVSGRISINFGHGNARSARRPVQAAPVTRGYRTTYVQPRSQEIVLGNNMHFGRSEFRKDIVLGRYSGRFNSIQIEGTRGNTYVMKIAVEYMNNTAQFVDVNRVLRAGDYLNINLDGRNRKINRIFIYRADGPQAQHMNERHPGSFAVYAY